MLKETMTTTIGCYLATLREQVGVNNCFMVPADYNLVLLDKLQENPKLVKVHCCNELNCSFAAEGYAPLNGIAAIVVTFSVGAVSTFNGLASAYGENLPVILIAGVPNTNEPIDHNLLHHTTYDLDL